MKKSSVKDENRVEIWSFKDVISFIKSFLEEDDDIEEEWENEPNKKALEEALEKVDKMAPKTEPATTSKKGKTRKISELTSKNIHVEKAPKIKDAKINNKDKIEEEREHE